MRGRNGERQRPTSRDVTTGMRSDIPSYIASELGRQTYTRKQRCIGRIVERKERKTKEENVKKLSGLRSDTTIQDKKTAHLICSVGVYL